MRPPGYSVQPPTCSRSPSSDQSVAETGVQPVRPWGFELTDGEQAARDHHPPRPLRVAPEGTRVIARGRTRTQAAVQLHRPRRPLLPVLHDGFPPGDTAFLKARQGPPPRSRLGGGRIRTPRPSRG